MCTGCMERLPFLRNYEISRPVHVESNCDVEVGTSVGTSDASPTLPADQDSTVVRSTPSNKTSSSGVFKFIQLYILFL